MWIHAIQEPKETRMHASNDSFHWKYFPAEIHQVEKLRFLVMSWYKLKLKFGSNLNLYRGIWVSRFGEFWECSMFSGICHLRNPLSATHYNTLKYTATHTTTPSSTLQHTLPQTVTCTVWMWQKMTFPDIMKVEYTHHMRWLRLVGSSKL